MAKKQNYWYILVMTDNGPVFVTKVNYSNKTAEWNKLEKPLEFNQYVAKDTALGLNLNFNMAYAVCYPVPIETQPYRYEIGQFEWKFDKEEQDND